MLGTFGLLVIFLRSQPCHGPLKSTGFHFTTYLYSVTSIFCLFLLNMLT